MLSIVRMATTKNKYGSDSRRMPFALAVAGGVCTVCALRPPAENTHCIFPREMLL